MKYQQKLFQFYGSASFFQFGFHGFSISFGNMFFDGVGSSINGSFGFFQAQAGQFTNNFDYVDLAGTSFFQHNVEFGLFSSGSAGSRSSHGSGGNAELLLQSVDELGELQNSQTLNLFDEALIFSEAMIGNLLNKCL